MDQEKAISFKDAQQIQLDSIPVEPAVDQVCSKETYFCEIGSNPTERSFRGRKFLMNEKKGQHDFIVLAINSEFEVLGKSNCPNIYSQDCHPPKGESYFDQVKDFADILQAIHE
eukprot:TRINITY_DN1797_c0_g1_i1.p1 TRINITY_DN1797_c0_g1~~TRINITY_DN1797_c0_g1_i1.p1  ORF type:complete len:114 (-),score=21.36 TRINITY_DN1797_c0_g1_i1:148-489(-)